MTWQSGRTLRTSEPEGCMDYVEGIIVTTERESKCCNEKRLLTGSVRGTGPGEICCELKLLLGNSKLQSSGMTPYSWLSGS